MGSGDVLADLRVVWWAGPELSSPQAALVGALLRAEMTARCPGLRPVLLGASAPCAADAGLSGEPWVTLGQPAPGGRGSGPAGAGDARTGAGAAGGDGRPDGAVGSDATGRFDLVVATGGADLAGQKFLDLLVDAGARAVAVAPDGEWGMEEQLSVGGPFAVPEPALLARRHLSVGMLESRQAYLRVVEGLPARYVLVEDGLLEAPIARADDAGADGDGDGLRRDLSIALAQLAGRAGGATAAEVVVLAPGALADDPEADGMLRRRRSEEEEGRYQPEDWPGNPGLPLPRLRLTNPLDLAAAVAGAGAVVARTGPMMALAWALGVPHVALGEEDGPTSNFAAWTGDASALAESPDRIVATMDSIFARRGQPPGLRRLEATLDQSLDDAAARLRDAAQLAAGAPGGPVRIPPEERVRELEAANETLRRRLAAERLRFGERAALLEGAANTSVESAIKAVHGQDVIVRRRLEETEREMRRLQEETALQQAELRAIHSSMTMRALAPAREWYGRLRRAAR